MNKQFIKIFFLIYASVLIFGCANQLPPSGGDDDTTPPRVTKIIPSGNTLNYSGNTITLNFSEYVDRRSLKDAIFISPKPQGELNYNWSGKSVEIEFPKRLHKNTTYTFIISKGLKDLHNNNITAPIQFAFSTGPVIDNGKISGKVFSQKTDNVMIFAYVDRGVHDSLMNPNTKFPDFFTQLNENNQFTFYHLPKEKFRLFALKDNNKNLLFDFGADEITVLNSDIKIEDTVTTYTANFLFPDYIPEDNFLYSEKNISTLVSLDTNNFLYSSLKNKDANIPIDSRFIFYFKNSKLTRFDIAENLRLIDTTDKKNYRLHYNWASDSVLEVTSTEDLKYSAVLKFVFDLSKIKYHNEIILNVTDERKLGDISGKVLNADFSKGNIYIKLFNQNIKNTFYSLQLENDSVYAFRRIPEGQYLLFSFIDENKNKTFDFGTPYPFKPSEKFLVFEPMLNLKGGWKIENVFIKF